MNRENQTFIEILYGHAKYIKDNSQCFDLKRITNLYVPNYFQRLNPAMHQAKELWNGRYKTIFVIYKVQ